VYKDGGAESIAFAYDANGVVSMTDGAGKVWGSATNDIGSVSLFEDPLGNLTRTYFDPEGKTVVNEPVSEIRAAG
jgi:hypothetical protein